MRRLLAIAALLLAASACGSSAAARSRSPIVFGMTGGNFVPFHVTIGPDGSVRASGSTRLRQKRLSGATLRRLQRRVRLNRLSSRNCPGTLPDVAARFISRNGRTVRVHGDCEPLFQRLWSELARAVGLR